MRFLLFLLLPLLTIAQSYHTISIDGSNDFNSTNEKFNSSSSGYFSYVTWDQNYLYLGYDGNDIGSGQSSNKWIVFYFDTDPQSNPTNGTGTTNAIGFNTQNWTLPFSANYMVQIRTDEGYNALNQYNGSGWNIVTPNNIDIYDNNSSNFIELRIPLSKLGNPKQINFLSYFISEQSMAEWTYGIVPSNSLTDGYYSSGTFTKFYNFYLIDQIKPNNSYNLDNYQWLIRMTASTSSLVDSTAYAGLSKNATDDYDAGIDLPKPPPAPSNYIEVYFPHADWDSPLGPNYARDFKLYENYSSGYKTWDLTVNIDQTNTNVTVSGDKFDFIPSNYEIILHDIDESTNHNLRSGSYNYNSGSGGARLFKLWIGFVSPNISSNVNALNFDTILVNDSTMKSFKIYNTGGTNLNISNITTSNSGFSVVGSTSFSVSPNDSATVTVKFKPLTPGLKTGTLTVTSNDPDTPNLDISLSGYASIISEANISSNVDTLNFNSVAVDLESNSSFKIYNTGTATLDVSDVVINGNNFTLLSSTSFSVPVNDSATISVKFRPSAVTNYNGSVVITSNAANAPEFTVYLKGTGVQNSVQNNFPAGWNLMSIPIAAVNPLTSEVIGDDVSNYFFYSYQNNNYVNEDSVFSHYGYWLGIESSALIDVQGTARTDTVSVHLAAGWNILSSPYIRALNKNSLMFKRGTETITADSAATRGWIQNNYYAYSTSNGTYSTKDTLNPWSGYWFSTLTDSVKAYFLHTSTFGSPVSKIIFDEPTLDNNNWYVVVNSKMGSKQDNLLVFGVAQNATDGFDNIYDNTKPPISPAPGTVYSYFERNDWNQYHSKFASDIKSPLIPNQSGKEWSFSIRTTAMGSLVLSWNDILSQIPEQIRNSFKFVLTGFGITGSIEMLQQTSVTINITSVGIYNYKINATPVTGIKEETIPESYGLMQNYPNPFNPSTVIKFQLPVEHGNQLVTLKIFDILGNEVATLVNNNLPAGEYSYEFGSSGLASGIYIYQLKAGSYINTKRMLLIK